MNLLGSPRRLLLALIVVCAYGYFWISFNYGGSYYSSANPKSGPGYRKRHAPGHAPRRSWSSGYNISDSCLIRPNRTNPRYHPDKFPCPIPVNFGKSLTTTLRDAKYSSRTCVRLPGGNHGHCAYDNVCYDASSRIMFFQPPNASEPLRDADFGWDAYRERNPRKGFSWHWGTRVITATEDKLPKNVKWLEGTSIWFDQSFGNICHTGHSSEFYTKLVELRHRFPGPVERVLYATDQEFKGRADAYKYCFVPCNLMRLGFEDRDWVFPTIYWLPQMNETKNKETLCFDRLLVPENAHQQFTSQAAAERHRNKALSMCKIPRRTDETLPTQATKVFFFERGVDRQFNSEQLCALTRQSGYDAYLETLDDVPDFCKHVATIYSADIIVTVHGSHNHLLAYARPRSVVVFIQPLNLAVPDWKVLAYYAGLHSVELSTFNVSYARANPNVRESTNNMTPYLIQDWKQCVNGWPCRIMLRHRDTYVPWETLKNFLDYGRTLWNSATFDDCEVPMLWPYPIPKKKDEAFLFRERGYENNWKVCEPPDAERCLCCHNAPCMQLMAEFNVTIHDVKQHISRRLNGSVPSDAPMQTLFETYTADAGS